MHAAGTGGIDPRVYEQVRARSLALLDEEAEKTRKAGLGIVEKHRSNGRPDEQIVALAEELEAGLGGMKRALVGSVSDSVVRHAHCPVLVARGGRLH